MGGVRREVQEERIQRAEELLVESMSASAVVAELCREFNIKDRAGWRYIAKARARWAEEAAELGPEAREEAREKMRRTLLYVKSRGFKSKELRIVLGATKQLRDLDGLDVPKELRFSGAIGMVDTGTLFAQRSTDDLISFLRTGRLPPEGEEIAEG